MPRWDVLRNVRLGNTCTDAPVLAPIGSPRAMHAVDSAGETVADVLSVTRNNMFRRIEPRNRYGWESATTDTQLERGRSGRDHRYS